MNNRQRAMAVLNYEKYDRLPIVHFGYWYELLEQWAAQGHITEEEFRGYGDGNQIDIEMNKRLGWDFCWTSSIGANSGLMPGFEYKELSTDSEGFVTYVNHVGLIEKKRNNIVSIPVTVGTMLTDRKSWEENYLPRLQPNPARYPSLETSPALREFSENLEERPFGAHVGSLYGSIRDMLGVEELSYLYADDEDLYKEVIDTVGNLCYENAKGMFALGLKIDFIHFWEDICFKNGPLVSPAIFEEYVAPHYKRITDLAKANGTKIVSLDCDGCIDKLVPIWFENGVNTMFPIEIGTWDANITPWRNAHGKELRGVGGVDKKVFMYDYAAVDAEIERLRPQIELGGFLPCPDHRLAPDSKWENVQYYCDKMKKIYSDLM